MSIDIEKMSVCHFLIGFAMQTLTLSISIGYSVRNELFSHLE